MLGVSHLGLVPAEDAAGVQELRSIQGTPALVALVATSVPRAAVGAGARDVPVGKEAQVGSAVHEGHSVLVDIAALSQPVPDVVGYPLVVGRAGSGEEVEANAHPAPGLQELGVEAPDHLRGRDAFLLRPHRHWCAVLVAARDHQHVIAQGTVVAGKDIGG